MNDQVVVGYLTAGQPEAAFVSSLTRLLSKQENRIIGDIQIISGPNVDSARNQLFDTWLNETVADYFLMVDDDMVLPPDAITRLRGHRKDIIGGLCFSQSLSGITRPVIHIMEEDENGKPHLAIMYDYPTDTVLEVAGTGGACMLVTRRCAKAIKDAMGDHAMPWFAFGMHNNVRIGEDIGFCLRAAKVGYKTFVDTGLEVPHIKRHTVGEVEYIRSLLSNDHPYYDLREKVPIYQELVHGDVSQHGDRSGNEGVSGSSES